MPKLKGTSKTSHCQEHGIDYKTKDGCPHCKSITFRQILDLDMSWNLNLETGEILIFRGSEMVLSLSSKDINGALSEYEHKRELEILLSEAQDCTECGDGKLLPQPRGGVKCNKCPYWFF